MKCTCRIDNLYYKCWLCLGLDNMYIKTKNTKSITRYEKVTKKDYLVFLAYFLMEIYI